MLRDFELPAGWPLPSPSVTVDPAPAREAATVMLLRDGAAGVEVWVLRRARLMAFAGGMIAFPGGSRDAADGDLVDTAVRETAEECGVRLADREALRPWARWVTPEHEPRRFDTMFYAVALPAGMEPVATNEESEVAFWVPARQALAERAAGRFALLPPTQVCLEDLAAAPDVAALLATPRRIGPVSPWLVRLADGRTGLRVDLDGAGGGRSGPVA
jgi:8-oxo-dGTP pyrophosphatase MutT (NUDIX family)